MIQPVEQTLLRLLGDARAERGAAGGLLDDQQAVRAPHAGGDSVPVHAQRIEGAQVDHLGVDARGVRRFHAHRHHVGAGHHGAGAAGAHDPRLAEGDAVIEVVRHERRALVERLALDDRHRVVAANGAVEEADVIERRRRRDDPPARPEREHAGRVHRVLRAVAAACRHPGAHDQRRAVGAAEHVADLGRLVEELVGRDQAEIGVHDLDNRAQPVDRGAEAHAAESVFGDRRADQTLGEGRADPLGGADRAALQPVHVLAEHDHGFVPLHRAELHGGDRFDEGHLARRRRVDVLRLHPARARQLRKVAADADIDLLRVRPQRRRDAEPVGTGLRLGQRRRRFVDGRVRPALQRRQPGLVDDA